MKKVWPLTGIFTYRQFVRYVIRLLEREINVCGLDTPAGQEAKLALVMLKAAAEQIPKRSPAAPPKPRQKVRGRTIPSIRPPDQNA